MFPGITDSGTIVSVKVVLIKVYLNLLSYLPFGQVVLSSEDFCIFETNVVLSKVCMLREGGFLMSIVSEICAMFFESSLHGPSGFTYICQAA